MVLKLTGTHPGGAYQVHCPTNKKIYVVWNSTAGAVTFKTVAGTGIPVNAGAVLILYCDGTNVIQLAGGVWRRHDRRHRRSWSAPPASTGTGVVTFRLGSVERPFVSASCRVIGCRACTPTWFAWSSARSRGQLTTSGFRKACARSSARPSWSRAAFLEGPHFELSRVEYPA